MVLHSGVLAMTQLIELELSYMSMTGTIPPGITALSRLTFLGLAKNNLTGTIPQALSTMPLLRCGCLLWLPSCVLAECGESVV